MRCLRSPLPVRVVTLRTFVSAAILGGVFAAALVLATGPAALAGDDDVALVGGRVLTASGKPLARGTVLLVDGKIEAVGADVPVPEGVRVIDCAGLVVTPGLIDADSSLGTEGSDRYGGNVGADQQAADAFDWTDDRVAAARRQGVTALILTGNTRDTLGGAAAVVTTTGEVLRADGPLVLNLATDGQAAGAWGAARVAALRKLLVAAQDRRDAVARWERDLADYEAKRQAEALLPEEELLLPPEVLAEMASWSPAQRAAWREAAFKAMGRPKDYTKPKDVASPPKAPKPDANLEALATVLDPDRIKRRPVLLRVELEVDVQAALDLIREFRLDARLLGGEGLAADTDALVKRKVDLAISLAGDSAHRTDGPLAERGSGLAARLVAGGAEPALGTGGGGASRYLRLVAAQAIGEGLDPARALEAVTTWAASFAGVGRTTGRLEAGRRADVVVWSGDPFDAATRTVHVFVGGRDVR